LGELLFGSVIDWERFLLSEAGGRFLSEQEADETCSQKYNWKHLS
jgi:hypothetical protein